MALKEKEKSAPTPDFEATPLNGLEPVYSHRMTRKIITSFIYPPIPARNCDWQAHFDGDEPDDDGRMTVGHGATEQEAIDDLLSFESAPPHSSEMVGEG